MGQYPANFLKLAAVLLLAVCAARGQRAANPADLIVTHAHVYTVNAKQQWAEAIAIRQRRVVAVGATAGGGDFCGAPTPTIDAQKHLVLPRFYDSHIHFMEGALSLEKVNLDETKNVAEIQQKVKAFAAAHPKDAWVLGRGWSYPEFPGGMPDKKYLDEAIPDRPVYIEGFDGHTGWANSKALQLSGITKSTANPTNGEIVRDPQTGEATG